MDENVKSTDIEPVSTRKTQDELEKGLEDTFPASDPPAATQPGSGRNTAQETGKKAG